MVLQRIKYRETQTTMSVQHLIKISENICENIKFLADIIGNRILLTMLLSGFQFLERTTFDFEDSY